MGRHRDDFRCDRRIYAAEVRRDRIPYADAHRHHADRDGRGSLGGRSCGASGSATRNDALGRRAFDRTGADVRDHSRCVAFRKHHHRRARAALFREAAAVFSFLLSLPIIAAAVVFEGRHAIDAGITVPLIAGVIAAAISGWLAISVLLKYVARHSYGVFAAYRLVVGVAVLLIAAM